MMRKMISAVAVAAAMLTIVGGVGSASAGTRTATVNVVHGIPGLDVDVCVNGAKAIQGFQAGDVVTGVELPGGRYNIKITPEGQPCKDAVLAAYGVGLWAGKNWTLIAKLDADGNPGLRRYVNKVAKTERGEARLTVRHAAAAPAVNVWANDAKLLGGRWFVNGKQKTFTVPAGAYEAFVSLPRSSTPVIGPAHLSLKSGYAYQVYAWGSGPAGYSFAVVATHVGVSS